ncbi:hypothetical protein KBD18_02230 [Patescibacteria group bacterium]|nr:hypothetical protein [Patescibacteria group bacterium]
MRPEIAPHSFAKPQKKETQQTPHEVPRSGVEERHLTPKNNNAESLRLIEERREGGTKKFDCAVDTRDTSVQTFHNERLGVFFITLPESVEQEDTEQATDYRTAAEQEITTRIHVMDRARLTRGGSFLSKKDPGVILGTSADRASVAMTTGLRAATDTILARAAAKTNIARITHDTQAVVRAENPTVPPSLCAIIHKDRLLPEAVYGVSLAPPGKKQAVPDVIWDPEAAAWHDISKENERIRQSLHDATTMFRQQQATVPDATEVFLKKIQEIQSSPALKDIHPDARLAMTEEVKGFLPQEGDGASKQKIEEALYRLREPDLAPQEAAVVQQLTDAVQRALQDPQYAEYGRLTTKGMLHIKKDPAFAKLSTTEARVVLFDRLQRQGILTPDAASELLTDTRMEIVAQTDKRLTAVVLRTNGAVVDISSQLIGEKTTNDEEVSTQTMHLHGYTKKTVSHVLLQPGDTVLFSTRNGAGETPATAQIRTTVHEPTRRPDDVLQTMQKNGFKGAVIRLP